MFDVLPSRLEVTNQAHAAQLLGAEGPFAATAGFSPRPGQQALARAIEQALATDTTLVAEAATGIGKTWAYLVPVLASGKQVVISTGTKHLQEQLFHRDLPKVCKTLKRKPKAALLKGRANYLCRYRLEQARAQGDGPETLESLHQWAAHSRSGDRAEVHWLEEDDPVWARATSTRDNCLGRQCAFFDDCFVYKARARAAQADLVVVNHDLLFASLAIKQQGVEDFLPEADAYILDEAHKVPAIAANHFGAGLTSGQLNALVDDALIEAGKVPGATQSVLTPVQDLRQAIRELGAALALTPSRGTWPVSNGDDSLAAVVAGTDQRMEALETALKPLADASAGLEHCLRRVRELRSLFKTLSGADDGWVHWYQRDGRRYRFHRTPLNVAEPFAELTLGEAAWVFTSATLTVAGYFEHFTRQLGLEAPHTLQVESEFDYPENSLLYLPEGLAEPHRGGYDVDALVRACLPVLEASRGRAFILFTSLKALAAGAALFRERFDLPLFVQGEAPRSELLTRFRDSGSGVLLGTKSFWEGVDVPGEALSLVVIDRLPFESPNDPVFQVRERAMKEQGQNPFFQWSLPEAVLTLKQGAGRLIRDVGDRGVLMICDPRITGRSYGKVFLDSLPPMPVTRELKDVRAFFREC